MGNERSKYIYRKIADNDDDVHLQQAQRDALIKTRKKTLFKVFVSILMVFSGTTNTLAAKWADSISAKGTNPKAEHLFIHPYVQTLAMFVGEASCLVVFQIVYYYHKLIKNDVSRFGAQKFSVFIFAIPAFCDVLASSMTYVGLNLTQASSFQMLRGSVIIFTALFSVAFFGSKLQVFHWVGILTVVIGLVVVGVGDVLESSQTGDHFSVLTGDLLIVGSQLIAAIQVIAEQRFLQGYNIPPLQGVGWEGIFGFTVVGVSIIIMHFIPWHVPSGPRFWQDHTRFEDAIDGFHQLFYIPTLTVAFFGTIVSLAFFNFAGLSVSKEENAVTRMVLDSIRILFIWSFGLIIKWQMFNYFQPIGFAVLVTGICIFYNVVFAPIMIKLHIWPPFCGAPDGQEFNA